MSKKPFIFIAVSMAAVAIFCIVGFIINNSDKDHTGSKEPGMVFVALQPVSGLNITGENPVEITPGANVSFAVTTDTLHYIKESDKYTYENGILNYGSIDTACTLYVSLGEYYSVQVNIEGCGTAETTKIEHLKDGDEVSLTALPDEGYQLKSIKINNIYQQLPEDSIIKLTVHGNVDISMEFEEIPAPPRTDFNVIIMDNDEAVILPEYANLAPGTIVTLPLGDADELLTGEYNIIGYNTMADYSGEYYAFGSMVTLGNDDLVLYPQRIKYADPADFSGRIINSRYLVVEYTGTPTDGIVCIPPYIDGVPVTDIRPDAFKNIEGLTTVIFPVGMRKLEDGTINSCPDFTTLILPQTMESVTAKAVIDCPNFKNLRVIGTLEHRFTDAFDAALADKYMRLQNTPGKRIIVVAGSSTTFGLSSQMLMDAFPDYSVVNFGSSYLSGMHVALQLLSPYIHEGDIVILAPEYYESTYAVNDPDNTCIWYSVESNLNMLKDIDVSTFPVILSKFASSMTLIRNSIATGKAPYGNSEYMLRHNFNEYGDLASVRPVYNTYVFTDFPTYLVTERGMNLINSFVDDFTKKGATCLFSFPPVYAKKISQTMANAADKHLERLSAALSENCPVISKPMDYAFTENVFFDNYYHATLEGATKRTELLIKDLNAYFDSVKH